MSAAGIPLPTDLPQNKLFRDAYPDLALQALQQQARQCVDCIAVDEGQDFESHWWVVLDTMLSPSESKGLYVFYDSNQRVYSYTLNLPRDVGLVPIRLRLHVPPPTNVLRAAEWERQAFLGRAAILLAASSIARPRE